MARPRAVTIPRPCCAPRADRAPGTHRDTPRTAFGFVHGLPGLPLPPLPVGHGRGAFDLDDAEVAQITRLAARGSPVELHHVGGDHRGLPGHRLLDEDVPALVERVEVLLQETVQPQDLGIPEGTVRLHFRQETVDVTPGLAFALGNAVEMEGQRVGERHDEAGRDGRVQDLERLLDLTQPLGVPGAISIQDAATIEARGDAVLVSGMAMAGKEDLVVGKSFAELLLGHGRMLLRAARVSMFAVVASRVFVEPTFMSKRLGMTRHTVSGHGVGLVDGGLGQLQVPEDLVASTPVADSLYNKAIHQSVALGFGCSPPFPESLDEGFRFGDAFLGTGVDFSHGSGKRSVAETLQLIVGQLLEIDRIRAFFEELVQHFLRGAMDFTLGHKRVDESVAGARFFLDLGRRKPFSGKSQHRGRLGIFRPPFPDARLLQVGLDCGYGFANELSDFHVRVAAFPSERDDPRHDLGIPLSRHILLLLGDKNPLCLPKWRRIRSCSSTCVKRSD